MEQMLHSLRGVAASFMGLIKSEAPERAVRGRNENRYMDFDSLFGPHSIHHMGDSF